MSAVGSGYELVPAEEASGTNPGFLFGHLPAKVGPAQRKPFMFPPWSRPRVGHVYIKDCRGCGKVVARLRQNAARTGD